MAPNIELTEGALVRWTKGDGLGFISSVDGGRVVVEWDVPGNPPQFAKGSISEALERVHLPSQVRSRSRDTPGILGEQVAGDGPPRWHVTMLTAQGFKQLTLPELDLRPDHALDPVGKMTNGFIGSTDKFLLRLAAWHYRLQHLHNDLVSLSDARVDIKPHQVSVVHRVVESYPHRFLLCDEVGLGKTIEAGMILKELRSRGTAARVLVVVPANLTRQWQFELKSKFNESLSILNTNTVRVLLDQGADGNPFAQENSVIVSSRWVSDPKWADLAAQVDWDLVIIDEAHHARGPRAGGRATRLYNFARQLADPGHFAARSMLFLTATPMQLAPRELYSLIELLDPALFPTEEHFDQNRTASTALSTLWKGLIDHGFPVPGQNAAETSAAVAEWLEIDAAEAEERLERGADELQKICDELRARHLLSEILIRNRKVDVGGFMPRHAHRWEVQLTEAESDALRAVEAYVQKGFNQSEANRDNAIGFVMVIFQKLMASSTWALRQSLDGRRARLLGEGGAAKPAAVSLLEDELDDDQTVESVIERGPGAMTEVEAQQLADLVTILDQVEVDSKAAVLLEKLTELFETDPDAKVLLFTEFRETQSYLARRMADAGWNVHLFHGQMDGLAKDTSVEEFRKGSGPQILVSTEAGGEGRNFQFCHILVNYDLPWNPMRVEQRIGRVDRIGQNHTVQIFNLWVKGTIEERVLDVLENRIHAFEETVGGLDPILGDAEKDLRKILRKGAEERERALKEYEENLEKQVAAARVADVKLHDFIMETKSFRREIAERITGQVSPVTPEDQERFMLRLLADVRTHIKELTPGEYQLRFSDQMVRDMPSYFAGQRDKRRGVFQAALRPDSEYIEYFAFGHPVVEAVLDQVLSPDYDGVNGTWQVRASDDMRIGEGWLFAYVVTTPGLRESRELLAVFVPDDGTADAVFGETLVRRAAEFPPALSLSSADLPLDGLEGARSAAEALVAAKADELQEAALVAVTARIEQQRNRLTTWFTYRERAARDRLASAQRILGELQEAEEENRRRVIPLWESNVERATRLIEELAEERSRQLAELDGLAHPAVDWELVAAGRIEVVGE